MRDIGPRYRRLPIDPSLPSSHPNNHHSQLERKRGDIVVLPVQSVSQPASHKTQGHLTVDVSPATSSAPVRSC
eukprot:scaffold41937_cov58-Attheya_sp.AAC.3